MKRWLGLTLASALIAVSMVGGSAVRGYGQQGGPSSPPNFQAQQAADNWLALVDQGRYGESYDQASQAFKVAVGREDWIHKVTAARNQAGKLISRRFVGSNELRNPPKAPPGRYIAIRYQTTFAKINAVSESVVLVFEKDGKWRLENYVIK